MDDADMADVSIQQTVDAARARAAAPALRARGTCHFCGECVTGKLLYCDTYCRDDHRAKQDQLRRMGR